MRAWIKLLLVAVAVVVAGVVIGFYVSHLTTLAGSPAYTVPVHSVNGHPVVDLEFQTVAAVGPKLSQNPDWVSYLIKTKNGWKRMTVWDLPANATVHVTWFNFDGASGSPEPVSRPAAGDSRQSRSSSTANRSTRIDPNLASHTFAVPGLGIIVAIARRPRRRQEPVRLRPVLH